MRGPKWAASQVPATAAAPTTPAPAGVKAHYYYSAGGEQQGPVEIDDLKLLRKEGAVTEDALVFREGESQWRKFKDFPELVK